MNKSSTDKDFWGCVPEFGDLDHETPPLSEKDQNEKTPAWIWVGVFPQL